MCSLPQHVRRPAAGQLVPLGMAGVGGECGRGLAAPCAQVMARVGHCCRGDAPGVMFHRSLRCQAAVEIRRLQKVGAYRAKKSASSTGWARCVRRRQRCARSGPRGKSARGSPPGPTKIKMRDVRAALCVRHAYTSRRVFALRPQPCTPREQRDALAASSTPNCRTEIAYAHASAHERQAGYVGKLLSSSLIRDTSVVRPIHGLTSALREVSATHSPTRQFVERGSPPAVPKQNQKDRHIGGLIQKSSVV
jgi:hypothetical protein